MSPEQVRNFEAVDGRADIWSLGAILYELITGRMIHDEQSIGMLLARICYLPVAGARTHRPEVPEDLDRLVLRCLERDPDRRIQDVQELARALLPFASPAAGRAWRASSRG